jgi:hypothetical protein
MSTPLADSAADLSTSFIRSTIHLGGGSFEGYINRAGMPPDGECREECYQLPGGQLS